MKIIALLMLLSGAALADRLEYVDRDKDTGAAQVEHARGRQSVKEGDDIPGWGRVHKIDEQSIQVVRLLTDAERQARKARGQVPVNAEVFVVPRRDQHSVPVTPPNQESP